MVQCSVTSHDSCTLPIPVLYLTNQDSMGLLCVCDSVRVFISKTLTALCAEAWLESQA